MLTPNGAGGAVQYNYGAATKELSHYVKINRSFTFDDGGDVPQDQIYFVTWASDPNEALGTTNDALNYRLRAIVYWREPRGA